MKDIFIRILVITLIMVFHLGLVSLTEASLTMSLSPSSQSVNVEEIFSVDIVLDNPDPLDFLSLMAWVKFDTAYLEVVDKDDGNWVTDGINIWDGDYHGTFPLSMLTTNLADNTAGDIDYQGGVPMVETCNGDGVFATIYFRAKALTSETSVWLDTGSGGLGSIDFPKDTSVMGTSYTDILEGVNNAAVNVIPEPGSLFLLISGLIGIFAFVKRNKV